MCNAILKFAIHLSQYTLSYLVVIVHLVINQFTSESLSRTNNKHAESLYNPTLFHETGNALL